MHLSFRPSAVAVVFVALVACDTRITDSSKFQDNRSELWIENTAVEYAEIEMTLADTKFNTGLSLLLNSCNEQKAFDIRYANDAELEPLIFSLAEELLVQFPSVENQSELLSKERNFDSQSLVQTWYKYKLGLAAGIEFTLHAMSYEQRQEYCWRAVRQAAFRLNMVQDPADNWSTPN